MASRRSDATVTVAPDVVVSGAPFGVSVTNQAALKVTAFYAGIRIRSENIASFPKYVKRMTKDGLVDDKRHPAYKVINVRPNSYTNKFDFWNVINTWLDELSEVPKTEVFAEIARRIDLQIHAGYQLFPGNYVAADMLSGTPTYAGKYTAEEKHTFETYLL